MGCAKTEKASVFTWRSSKCIYSLKWQILYVIFISFGIHARHEPVLFYVFLSLILLTAKTFQQFDPA